MSDRDIILIICDVLDIKERKSDVIKSQKYEEGAKLRDTEKQLLYRLAKLMVDLSIYNDQDVKAFCTDTRKIEDYISKYLRHKYDLGFYDEGTPKSLKRQIKLEEIFRNEEELDN